MWELFLKKTQKTFQSMTQELGMVVHASDPGTQEASLLLGSREEDSSKLKAGWNYIVRLS